MSVVMPSMGCTCEQQPAILSAPAVFEGEVNSLRTLVIFSRNSTFQSTEGNNITYRPIEILTHWSFATRAVQVRAANPDAHLEVALAGAEGDLGLREAADLGGVL